MNKHTIYEQRLALYAAGKLPEKDYRKMEAHLAECPICQADLALWQSTSSAICTMNQSVKAPESLSENTVQYLRTKNRPGLGSSLRSIAELLKAQSVLIRQEMWPASAIVMLIGIAACWLLMDFGFIYFLSPLVAATSLALIFGPENDPALELTCATPYSPWKILLARLSLVSGYNFGLALLCTVILNWLIPTDALGTLVLGWLGPVSFLSALALFLSIWIGTSKATAVVYALWILQYIPFEIFGSLTFVNFWNSIITAYKDFWHEPILLLSLAAVVMLATLLSANRAPRLVILAG
jgi:hypothetical protein